MKRMPNRFTRIPDGPVPPLPRLGRILLPLADAFMLLMLSRPASGSLRATWVTPATLGLGVVVALLAAPLAVIAFLSAAVDGSTEALLLAIAATLLATGSGSVAVVGWLQYRLLGYLLRSRKLRCNIGPGQRTWRPGIDGTDGHPSGTICRLSRPSGRHLLHHPDVRVCVRRAS